MLLLLGNLSVFVRPELDGGGHCWNSGLVIDWCGSLQAPLFAFTALPISLQAQSVLTAGSEH